MYLVFTCDILCQILHTGSSVFAFVCVWFNVWGLYSVGTTVGVIVSVNSKSNSVTADSIFVGLE